MSFKKVRSEAAKRYIESDLSLVKLHEEIALDHQMEGKKPPTLTTIKRWSKKERWPDRRDEWQKARRRQELRRIHDKLRQQGPSQLEKISDYTSAIIDRNIRLLLPAAVPVDEGGMCDNCGRGIDTDDGKYVPKVGDTVRLMKLQLDLHGQLVAMGGAVGGVTPLDQAFPGQDEPEFMVFVRDASELFAKHEGAIPETHITPDGEIGEGPDLGGDGDDD